MAPPVSNGHPRIASGAPEAWKFESNPPAWFKRVTVGRADFAKAVEAHAGRVVPQSTGIHRAESDVVRAAIFGRARILEVMRRDADYPVGTGDATRRLERKILLPEMHSVRAGENRDIDPIVDDENRAALAAHLGDRARGGEKIASGRVLQPQLHDSGAGLEQNFRQRNGLVSARGIDHRVEVRGEARHPAGNLVNTILWSVIFLRSVLRLSPSIRAARTWLPPARLSASSTSGRSISATSRW